MACSSCGSVYKPDYFNPENGVCPCCIAWSALDKSKKMVDYLCHEGEDPSKELTRQETLRKALEHEKERSIDYEITHLHEKKHDDEEKKFPPLEEKKSYAIAVLYSMSDYDHWREVGQIAEATTAVEVDKILDKVIALEETLSSLKAVYLHSPKVQKRIDSVQNVTQLETLMQELHVS